MADENVRVLLDLPRLGEVIAVTADKFAEMRGLRPLEYEDAEMRELAAHVWAHVIHMADRAEFARSVKADIADLAQTE